MAQKWANNWRAYQNAQKKRATANTKAKRRKTTVEMVCKSSSCKYHARMSRWVLERANRPRCPLCGNFLALKLDNRPPTSPPVSKPPIRQQQVNSTTQGSGSPLGNCEKPPGPA